MRLELYQSKPGRFRRRAQRWRFRFVADNGKVLAVSSEAYVNKSDAADAAKEIVASGWEWKED